MTKSREMWYNWRAMHKFQYYTPDVPQKRLGAYITVAGMEDFGKGAQFPSPLHKSYYFFKSDNGRRLEGGEHQLLYIRSGKGVTQFERGGKIPLKAGSVNILRPGEWHRHSPDRATGWSEAYIGIGGEVVERVVKELFPSDTPIVIDMEHDIGFDNAMMSLIDEILASNAERPYSLAMKTLSLIVSLSDNSPAPYGKVMHYSAIRKASIYIGHHLSEPLDFKAIAARFGMTYSLFRLRFREMTGMAPLAYHLSLRIRRAKRLLETTDMSVTEISKALGFASLIYFSRFFHKATGFYPRAYRERNAVRPGSEDYY